MTINLTLSIILYAIAIGLLLKQWVSKTKGIEKSSLYAAIGAIPQDLKFGGEISHVKIGPEVTIREFVTIHRGTKEGGGITEVGEKSFLMAYTHIAHDCRVGKMVVLANNTTLAGHIVIGNHATVGGHDNTTDFSLGGTAGHLDDHRVATDVGHHLVRQAGRGHAGRDQDQI